MRVELPPLQSLMELTTAYKPPSKSLSAEAAAEPATVTATGQPQVTTVGRSLPDGSGVLADGTRWVGWGCHPLPMPLCLYSHPLGCRGLGVKAGWCLAVGEQSKGQGTGGAGRRDVLGRCWGVQAAFMGCHAALVLLPHEPCNNAAAGECKVLEEMQGAWQ